MACIASGSSNDPAPSRSVSVFLRSANILFSSSNTLRNSSTRLLVRTSSSANSWRSIATRRSFVLLRTSPTVGSSSPARMRTWVVFPPPLGPTRPMRSPVVTPQETDLMTSWFLKVTPTFSRARETKPGWTPSMMRTRGGGRSFRILSSKVIFFFSSSGASPTAAGCAPSSAASTSSSAEVPFFLFFLSALAFAFFASFSSFFSSAFCSFLLSGASASANISAAGCCACCDAFFLFFFSSAICSFKLRGSSASAKISTAGAAGGAWVSLSPSPSVSWASAPFLFFLFALA
mmetsp:Transcript_6374/g.13356  ORF Transcript_6374/g.13356 Transcript_6374/m.13356 type:complete len:290 (+) Transcript_6374:1484-2353(+)